MHNVVNAYYVFILFIAFLIFSFHFKLNYLRYRLYLVWWIKIFKTETTCMCLNFFLFQTILL